MVRLRIAELLKELNWTPYRLAKELGMTEPAVYRLVRQHGRFSRLSAKLLDRLCTVTNRSPGDLIEWAPDKRKGR